MVVCAEEIFEKQMYARDVSTWLGKDIDIHPADKLGQDIETWLENDIGTYPADEHRQSAVAELKIPNIQNEEKLLKLKEAHPIDDATQIRKSRVR